MDREIYRRIRSSYMRIKAAIERLCASFGKRSKIEEEEREAQK